MLAGHALEVRLAAWYSLLLLAGLAALGGVLWYGVDYSLTASVDDQLRERIVRLERFVEAEFGTAQEAINIQGDEAELKGVVRRLDDAAGVLVIGETEVNLTEETLYERGSEFSSAADLAEGQFLGIELSREDGAWIADEVSLERSFAAELREELAEMLMASPDGRWIWIRTGAGEPFLPAEQDDSSIPWLTAGVETVGTEAGAYRVMQAGVSFAGEPFQVQTAGSLEPVLAARRRLLSWLAWAVPLGLIVSLGGGYLISRRALEPIENVVRVAGTMDMSRLGERLEAPPTGDVVERLAKTFNGMLDRLDNSVRRLEEFTADASHELRSPVSVIRTTAELAMRQARSEDELRADMQEIVEEADKLTELIEDLLTLARAGSGAAGDEKEMADLGVLAIEVGEQYQRLHPERQVEVRAEHRHVFVAGHEPSLRRLLSILLDNAVRHTPGNAEITLRLEANGSCCRVSVEDTGAGIPEEDLPRIFDRFYRADSSRNRTNGGFGLGLAIASWIAESHGSEIKVFSKPGEGAMFAVDFPWFADKAGEQEHAG